MFKKLIAKCKFLLILGRYNYPTGAFLLMWPCLWGLAFQIRDINIFIKYSLLFFIGSFIMRGAGCCINDLFDKKYDSMVSRTRNRPLASGKLKNFDAISFVIFQLILGLIILVQFNLKIVFFAIGIMPLVIIYPIFKRVVNFPQLFLGIVFNWGIILGFLVENRELNLQILMLYVAGVLFTIGYDTIYGMQDIKDDKKIGVKSLSILVEKNKVFFISIIYFCSFIFFSISFFYKNTSLFFSLSSSIIIFVLFFFQLYLLREKKFKKIFDLNILVGGTIFLIILFQNFF